MRYKNRMIINQRGGSINIDNSTDSEKIQISHRSGSNINLTNVTTSELATNNKQVNIINDEFKTVGNNSSEFIAKDKIERVGESIYKLKGVVDGSQIEAFQQWKELFKPIALKNSQFKISRGGSGYPNGQPTPLQGSRASNPVLSNTVTTVENSFSGYTITPIRDSTTDEVANYAPVTVRTGTPATPKSISPSNISKSAGATGSSAAGVLEFGSSKSAATEGGSWGANPNVSNLSNDILNLQDQLTPIEQQMGDGGDEVTFVKKNKIETVGAAFNDYPSIRVDEKGRSQPFEVIVSDAGAFKNDDYAAVVEDVDNSSFFPGGEETKIVGNKYNLTVGSGGYNLKTTGSVEMGGTTFKGGFKKCNISANYGIHLISENIIELSSLKTITLRTNRQVLVESALGVKNNIVTGGGLYTEGEMYVQHITAPVEIQQTETTQVFGKFNTTVSRELPIGEVLLRGYWIGDVYVPPTWRTVYALPTDNLISNYSHSHHFKNVPLRLCGSNSDVRKFAQSENINSHGTVSPALPQRHELKQVLKSP